MHGHHMRHWMKHGMNDDDPDAIVCRMRFHGMDHGPGHDPSMCGRHFFTKEEKTDLLKRYKEWLDKESKGVQEMLEELK